MSTNDSTNILDDPAAGPPANKPRNVSRVETISHFADFLVCDKKVGTKVTGKAVDVYVPEKDAWVESSNNMQSEDINDSGKAPDQTQQDVLKKQFDKAGLKGTFSDPSPK